MLARLLLLFILLPFIELMILIRLGDQIGFWYTLALLVLMGLIGFFMVRSQGLSILQRIRSDIAMGVPPTHALIDGLLVFVGGLLLITPGLITDFVGLLLLFPASRRKINILIVPWIINKILSSKRWTIYRW